VRGLLAESAASVGLRVAATGTPVLGDFIPAPITEGPRQDRGNATFRGLHDDLTICAVHVHVEIPERERALLVSNHLRPYLPVLISLTANSPFWAERDTEYASWRTMLWNRWPVAGPPPFFTSVEHYQQTVAMLHEVGAVVDVGTIFWDLRPSEHLPTLEVRVADVPITAEESALLAALVRAMVADALALVDAGDPGPQISAEALRVAYWRAARDGISGHGIDVATGKLVPAIELAERLLDSVRPTLSETGDLDRVSEWLGRIVRDGDGATRQRRAARENGSMADAVDYLVAHTAPQILTREQSTTA
jgi:glutamate---cysteine ligase / carboxylate-amine ligase